MNITNILELQSYINQNLNNPNKDWQKEVFLFLHGRFSTVSLRDGFGDNA